MPSTYSTNLKIELIATGEQDGTWGNTTNTNLGTALEQAIVGRAVVTFPSDADYTLTLTTSNAAQDARAVYLVVQGTISASRNLVVPTIFKNYVVKNATTGSQDIVVKTSAGTGVTIPNGKTAAVYVDGTNVIKEVDYVDGLALNSPTMTGTPTAPTAAPGTNTTQVATTAFTAAAVTAGLGTLGTIATQNANNVAITGGSISGITDLAVADGGTGASDASGARTNLGLGTIATQAANNVAITGGSITGITDLAVADGGTGASTAANARTNLGLGSIATQDASTVAITGGSITGITDLAIADGGTGASTSANARTNLGLGTIATQAANNVAITGGSITGITDLAVADGGTGASDAGTARTNLGLGTIATQAANNVAITGGSISGITDLALADGGTGASDASGARTNLGVPATDGTGASGTWSISITGNAATATTATSATALSTASGSAPSYSARAWVNFNGSGVVAIRASGNVTSITDNGTGDYTVNFTTAMANANYAVAGMTNRTEDSGSADANTGISVKSTAQVLTTSVTVRTGRPSQGNFEDRSYVSVSVYL